MPASNTFGIRVVLLMTIAAISIVALPSTSRADDFDGFLAPLFKQNCVQCHGNDEANGKVNLQLISSSQQFLAKPKLIQKLIQVIDANDMPPEGETQLKESVRAKTLDSLKKMLRQATVGQTSQRLPIRRLNRFQYNNAVKDLFELNRDLFALNEKLMTRYSNYLNTKSDRMPDRVNVASHALNPPPGLRGVNAFPKDLRASHGFDNQANQLTLSPLLLDSFLKLSVSIVNSPDFNEQSVGIWNRFFKAPGDDVQLGPEVRKRLQPFLTMAFRRPVDPTTLDRYSAYVEAKLRGGMSFPEAMKKVASAALSSPLFLYRSGTADGENRQFELASNLSFFLWSTGPDLELLRLAENGQLAKTETLNRTLDRMFADPKIERFLDSFPAQWMQLENVLAATPDPQKQRFFSLDKDNPASLQMLLEPLLLFDAVYIENRPIADFISPPFNYRSDFLQTWYSSDLKVPTIDRAEITAQNQRNDRSRTQLQATIASLQGELNAMIKPIKTRLLAERTKKSAGKKPVDLKPYAAWEFDGDLKSSVGSFDLKPHGKIEFQDGMVVLKRSFLQSGNLPIPLKAKSLDVWCKVHDVNQRGGGVMGIQGPGDFFDTIVLGERKPRHWISGSNGFSRTNDFPKSTPENMPNELLHLTMVYAPNGTTTLYRNGIPYGKPFRKGAATFPKDRTSVLFGLRHLPPAGNKYLSVSIDKARLYNRELTAAEVSSSHSGYNRYITDKELLTVMTAEQRAKHKSLSETLTVAKLKLAKVPQNRDPKQLQQAEQRRFDDAMRSKLRARDFQRIENSDPRYGGVITNAAMLSMTSGPKRTHPIARGAWIIEVILNDPPPPPPNDVPPLNEDAADKNLTIREKFAVHRENPDCAGCHSRLDPLGFALENFDITGRWRDKYDNDRTVDVSGKLMRKYEYTDVVGFKRSLTTEKRRFAKAFTAHLLRFATSRELHPADSLTIDAIADETEKTDFKLRSILRATVLSESFFDRK